MPTSSTGPPSKKRVQRVEPGSASPSRGDASDARREKDAAAESPENYEDYSDPICVCEPEPYWQEIAAQLERERAERERVERGS